MDFYQIATKKQKDDLIIYPKFIIGEHSDFMTRGGAFYAIWNEKKGLWSTKEFDVYKIIDSELFNYKKEIITDKNTIVKTLSDTENGIMQKYLYFVKNSPPMYQELDNELTFANDIVDKSDYRSKKLPYALESGSIKAYDELMSILYDPVEREKLEWAVGSIIAGDAKYIQKFIVLHGKAGTGKGTFINIIQKLFKGYYTTFEAKELGSNNNSFSTEVFKNNPLIAIQHDGDLSKIEDNTKLNSIISHEEMTVNEKFKSKYTMKVNAMLFMGTNSNIKISDSKSGLIRRLIDVYPTGDTIKPTQYEILMSQIDFEIGAIAYHCLQVYKKLKKNYYASYRPERMMYNTDIFFNFIDTNYQIFAHQDGISGSQAFAMFKEYCLDANIDTKKPYNAFRNELESYFDKYDKCARIDGKQIRNYFSGFKAHLFNQDEAKNREDAVDEKEGFKIDQTISIIDKLFADCPAQLANDRETPEQRWSEVRTRLSDIDTRQLHYLKVPENYIVIDFDLKDEQGNKSVDRNLEAASKWPLTYAEFSKSGAGIHLHYIYDGDITKLSRIYSEGIEIKPFIGKESLRRRLTKCNNIPIAHINSGLPLKGDKSVINFEGVKSEKQLRASIEKNLRKESHPNTKPSIDFIYYILEETYKSGLSYDVTDLRSKILVFANNSSNQADYCIKLVNKMKFASENISENKEEYSKEELIFYDVEVFPNLFIVVWKAEGKDRQPVKMINPTPSDIEELLKFKLVGFNNRRYDNHILYARYIGYSNAQLYQLSQKIINNNPNCFFGEAYNISYTDIYDYASNDNKMSLKKWEIKLGIHHQELGLPWDQPVPEDMWDKVADYCINDVIATEATFNATSGDWAARQIMAALSGLSVNDTTNQHSVKMVLGDIKSDPDSYLIYTDLSEMFPEYAFDYGISTYRGIKTGEGGYVYAEPGMYSNVAVLDVASMHPTSIGALNYFGSYTKNYNDLKAGRVAIKHNDLDTLRTLLNGKLIPFIEDAMSDNPKFTMKDVSNGLKTALNSAYGLTSAKFKNAFKHSKNIDNIVAKRGALFMVDLQFAVQEKGFTVAHIKTDSIKIPNATPEIIEFVMEFGKKYGYEFEHEETYSKMCLVNDAVYIAKTQQGKWEATGAQFAQPYVFKSLFSHEPITLQDKCETKSVTSAMYLDMNEDLSEDEHNYRFIGKVGSFCPIKPGCGGGLLLREKDGKYHAATGTKGYRWLEAEMVKEFGKEPDIDTSYYINLVDDAVQDIRVFGDIEWFLSDNNDSPPTPWCPTKQCDKEITCGDCSEAGHCDYVPF